MQQVFSALVPGGALDLHFTAAPLPLAAAIAGGAGLRARIWRRLPVDGCGLSREILQP